MIFVRNITPLVIILGLLSCKGDAGTVAEEKSLQEIRAEGEDIASIIRNPVSADVPLDTINVAKLKFEEASFNFGTIYEGDVVRHTYEFTNVGKAPLVITHAQSTCGCTVPEWPKEPIPPGQQGIIEVKFDSQNKTGFQNKPITITANTYPSTTKIYLKGKVEGKGEQ